MREIPALLQKQPQWEGILEVPCTHDLGQLQSYLEFVESLPQSPTVRASVQEAKQRIEWIKSMHLAEES